MSFFIIETVISSPSTHRTTMGWRGVRVGQRWLPALLQPGGDGLRVDDEGEGGVEEVCSAHGYAHVYAEPWGACCQSETHSSAQWQTQQTSQSHTKQSLLRQDPCVSVVLYIPLLELRQKLALTKSLAFTRVLVNVNFGTDNIAKGVEGCGQVGIR